MSQEFGCVKLLLDHGANVNASVSPSLLTMACGMSMSLPMTVSVPSLSLWT